MKPANLLLAVTFVFALGAQAAAQHGQSHHRRVAHRYAARRTRHLSVEMRDDGRPTGETYAARANTGHRLRPAIETRINGATASFGLHPSDGRRTLDPNELNGAAAMRGHDEGNAGVSVKIPL